MAIDNLLLEARKARLDDNYEAAFAYCNAYLGAHPDDPEGESLLGLCEIESGKPAGARRIENAWKQKPASAPILLNLSILRERQGSIREAIQAATEAARHAPQSFESWAQLGKLLGKGEKYVEALAALEQAAKIKPDHLGVQSLIAAAALETGAFDRCKRALDRLPHSRETYRIHTHLARKRGAWAELQFIASEWLQAEPGDEEARMGLAHALGQQGYYDEAVKAYAPLYEADKANASHAAALGRYLLGGRRLADAERWFRNAISIDDKCVEAMYGMARLCHFRGDSIDAERWCRRALLLGSSHPDTLALLAETAARPGEHDLTTINEALNNTRLEESERIVLLFARGDVQHALKDADAAFDSWAAANELKTKAALRANGAYDKSQHEAKIDRLKALFPKIEPVASEGDSSPSPIFIVGMPRSGTTLLEAALAAHPEINAAGEVPAMPFILDEFINWADRENWVGGLIPQELLDGWRALYLNQAERFGGAGSSLFTDKQPSNFMSVGLIAQLFPAARVIYLRRNPVETGFSIFRRNFTRQWAFSTSFDSIAHYYAEHCRIADHWVATAPDRVRFIQYEDLVRNFEARLKDLIEFCGLEWDSGCLNYFEADRSVITFSASQVRKPPSEKHLVSTAPYAHRLGELRDALKVLGVNLETGERRQP